MDKTCRDLFLAIMDANLQTLEMTEDYEKMLGKAIDKQSKDNLRKIFRGIRQKIHDGKNLNDKEILLFGTCVQIARMRLKNRLMQVQATLDVYDNKLSPWFESHAQSKTLESDFVEKFSQPII